MLTIKEVIVVEGEHDRVAVNRAVKADVFCTIGHALSVSRMEQLKKLQEIRGLIILTDPDYAGEQIRRRLSHIFPLAKHAYIKREAAILNQDIGVENAAPDAILEALLKAKAFVQSEQDQQRTSKVPSWETIISLGLTGRSNSAALRAAIGEHLGIGYANAKRFRYNLELFGISEEELIEVWQQEVEKEVWMR